MLSKYNEIVHDTNPSSTPLACLPTVGEGEVAGLNERLVLDMYQFITNFKNTMLLHLHDQSRPI